MLINLGGLELNESRLDEAKKHLEAALQKEPEQPLAVINLAAVAVKQNDFKLAHELLESRDGHAAGRGAGLRIIARCWRAKRPGTPI